MVRIVLPDQLTPMLLETAVLLALAKLVRPRTYFEFGTLLGVETLNMAANLPPETRIYTLDLDEESARTLEQDEHDKPLTKIHMESQARLAFLGTAYEQRVTRLFGDSKRFDFSPFAGKIDMIYVDGGHDLPTLASDTDNALGMLTSSHAACIAWHDFQNAAYPQVTKYLSERSQSLELFHVEETRLAFHLRGLPEIAQQFLA
jgi:hypothetical protein